MRILAQLTPEVYEGSHLRLGCGRDTLIKDKKRKR